MSTVMRVWRIQTSEMWNVIDMVRAHYKAHHPVALEIAVLASCVRPSMTPDEISTLRREALGFARTGGCGQENWHPELQIFNEGKTCLLWPLEIGHWFQSQVAEQDWPFQEVNYDNRSDVPPEDEPNAVVAEWLNDQITRGRFVTHMLLDPTRLHLEVIRAFDRG